MITTEQILNPRTPTGPDKPIEHLAACHRRIEQRLETLERAASVFATRREEAFEAIRSAMEFLDTNGARHTEDEEESLFPRLLPNLSAEDAAAVEGLQQEHAEAEAAYAALKAILLRVPDTIDDVWAGQYRSAVAGLNEIYRGHIAGEDMLFPRLAAAVLSEADLAAIAGEMKGRRA